MSRFDELLGQMEESVFAELLEAVARRGKALRPGNFVWDILKRSLDVHRIYTTEEDPPVSPTLAESLAKHGQILPVWVEPDGRIIDGRARFAVLGEKTKYLVYPDYLPNEVLSSLKASTFPLCEIEEVKRWARLLWRNRR